MINNGNNCMKKVLFITGAVSPLYSTNANLMMRAMEGLQGKAECYLLSVGPFLEEDARNSSIQVNCIKYSTTNYVAWKNATILVNYNEGINRLYKAYAHCIEKIIDRNGYHDYSHVFLLQRLIEGICNNEEYDIVFVSNEPYFAALSVSRSKIAAEKILYYIDPFAEMVPILCETVPQFRHRTHKEILERVNKIITTPRIYDRMVGAPYGKYLSKTFANEFPLFGELVRCKDVSSICFDSNKINLLYCGWLRNASLLQNVIIRLDERFTVTIIGNGNEELQGVRSKAEIRLIQAVSREVAVNAILDADILLSIGNVYPVHIPSKTFDYISSGKPVIHFYSIEDCPARAIYDRYPLSLMLPNDSIEEEATRLITSFSLAMKDKTIPFPKIKELYPELDSEKSLNEITKLILNQ